MLYILMAGFGIWMAGCAYAGFHKRAGLFALMTMAGLALSAVWMTLGLNAPLLSPHALMAHAANLIYSGVAGVLGWFAGRVVRGFRESTVDPS
jgi:hypothetical protein